MPRYIASGIHDKPSITTKTAGAKGKDHSSGHMKYRFLVIQRFGDDLQKKLEEVNHTFDLKTAYTIAKKVIDILEYIHSFGYIHADIKASNLLLGRSYAPTPRGKGIAEQNGIHSEVWLVDFGLVEKYRTGEGEHKTCEEDQRRANNGTVEFTSRDSHVGALSRRSDLEILAFNMLSWLSGGRLPWMQNLKDHRFVHACKKYYMDRLHELFNYSFSQTKQSPPTIDYQEVVRSVPPPASAFEKTKLKAKVPPGILEYFQYIVKLDFTQDPDYDLLKAMLSSAIAKTRGADSDDGRFSFSKVPARSVGKITGRMKRSSLSSPGLGRRKLRNTQPEESESDEESPVRKPPARGRKRVEKNGTKEPESSLEETPVRHAVAKKVRSKSVSPIKSPCLSAPTSHATPQKTPDSGLKSMVGFDKPTPAMLEVLQRLKEKKKKDKSGRCLFLDGPAVAAVAAATVATAVPNGNRRGSSSTSKQPVIKNAAAKHAAVPTLSKSTDVPPRKRYRSASRSRASATVTTAAAKPAVNGDSKKLSSNSSTHSTKENKGRQQPIRRSPRVHV